MAEQTPETWERILAEAMTGLRSIRAIAADYNVSETAIRKHLRRLSGADAATEIKRRKVRSAVSLGYAGDVDHHKTMAAANELIAKAAGEDVVDMKNGVVASREILTRTMALISGMEDPRDLKVAADTVKTVIDTIRRIRGLDDETGRERSEYENMTDEELLNEFERLKQGDSLTADSRTAGTA